MGFHKFVIYGSILLFLLTVSVDSRDRWKRQQQPVFTPLQSVRTPWLPIRDNAPRLVRQDSGGGAPRIQDIAATVLQTGRNPGLRSEKATLLRSETTLDNSNQRARQINGAAATSGGWIPLAPQLDTTINLVEDEFRVPQFNPVISLPNNPGKRLPITAVDPILFNRDQSVELPATRQVLNDFFSVKPTPVFINEPIRATPVSVLSVTQRPVFPTISVQSVPARVNENRRPVFPAASRINRTQITSTISPIKKLIVNNVESAVTANNADFKKPVLVPERVDLLQPEFTTAAPSEIEEIPDESTNLQNSSFLILKDLGISSIRTEAPSVIPVIPALISTTSEKPTTTERKVEPVSESSPVSTSTSSTTSSTTAGREPSSSENSLSSAGFFPLSTEKELLPSTPVQEASPVQFLTPVGEFISSTERKPSFALDLMPILRGEENLTGDGVFFDENLPVILGPILSDVTPDSTQNLTLSEPMNQAKVVEPNEDMKISFAETAFDSDPKIQKNVTGSEQGLAEATSLTAGFNSTEELPGSSGNSTSKDDYSDYSSQEVPDVFWQGLDPNVPNGHQGPPPEEDLVGGEEIPLLVNEQSSLNSSESILVNIASTLPPTLLPSSGEEDESNGPSSETILNVMNGHQPQNIGLFESNEKKDKEFDSSESLFETTPSDYEYDISPPGLVFNFTQDFNVSLVDFGNGTVVLENKTYVLDPELGFIHPDNVTNQSELVNQEPVLDLTPNSTFNSIESEPRGNATVLFETVDEDVVPATSESADESGVPLTSIQMIDEDQASSTPKQIVDEIVSTTIQSIFEITKRTFDAGVSPSSEFEIVEVAETTRKLETTVAPTPSPAEQETSRELGRRTTPLATLISSIISSLRPQAPDVTTAGITTEKETTPMPSLTTTPSTSTTGKTSTTKLNEIPTSEPRPTEETPSSTRNIPSSEENAQEPEPRVPLYVRLSLDLTWKELCMNIDDFRATLATMVSKDPEISNSISPRQVVVYNVGRCALELHSSRRRRRLSEPVTALCYITDYHGIYSHRLTEALARSLNSDLPNSLPLAQKIISASPIKSSSESLAVGTHQHVPTTGIIAGVTVAVIVGLFVIGFLVFLLVVRRRQNRATYARRCEPGSEFGIRNSIRNLSWRQSKSQLRASKRSFMNYAYEDPNAPTRPLKANQLSEAVQDLAALEKEFKQIPSPATTLDDLPSGVEAKNRFSNVIPVPDTRVLLKPVAGDETSEYINANYVRGPRDEPQYYIACQAPLESTVPDFWRMIWEKQSKLIIQLTDLFENGSSKCADYLPPSEVLDCHRLYGDFQVTLKKRELKQGYIASFITLKHMNDNLRRDVVHYWFTGWPHTGVPEDSKQLVSMLTESRTAAREGSSPVVFHCCPGTGRTGTVITIDLLMRVVDSKKPVDVPRSVYKLRRDRTGCVQTKEQYQFIYQALSSYSSSLLSTESS